MTTETIRNANGDKFWYLEGKLHREDGPAIEYSDRAKCWYLNNERHRTDGPAIEYPDGEKLWYINGNWIDFEEITKRHELNSDYTQWTDSEKVLFRLAT